MTFTRSVEPDPAPGPLADLFAADRRTWGYLPNLATTFGARPDVYAAWRSLNGAIKSGMPARRYEVATLAAALELRSSYCSLAHGAILAAEHLGEEEVVALTAGVLDGLSPEDAAVVTLAALIVRDAPGVTAEDLVPLRAAGFDDDEIFAVILAVGARCFFSTVLDATGTPPDAEFENLPARLRDALTVGRPL